MKFSSIYESLEDTSIDNYRDFFLQLENQYQGLKQYDYKIDNEQCNNVDYNELDKSVLHDRFAINYKDYKFDCLMTPPLNNSISKSIFVIFSGYRDPNNDIPPIFKRWSYYKFIDSYVLNISDPMFYKYKDLPLGWYYGTRTDSCLEYLSDIVKRIQKILEIDDNRVIFFGSSGGGYVSLMMSLYFKNSLHIAINPQIQINKFHGKGAFEKITGINLDEKDFFQRNETIDIINQKCQNRLNKFFILQNIQDQHDCTYHLFPLLKAMNITKLHLGLNKITNSFLCWIYSCQGGHNAQGDQFIFSLILNLAQKMLDEETITDNDNFLYKIISCIWHQIEWLKNNHIKQNNEIIRLQQSLSEKQN